MVAPNDVNGMQMPIAIIRKVSPSTGQEAVLWMNGIFRVRIMCTMRVCDSNPSMNQPDWKSDCISGDVHPKMNHISS